MIYISSILIFFANITSGCKKSYNPPAIKVDNKFLVIDGVLVNSPDSPSIFTLSRTIKLTDSTFSSSAETGAVVSVEGKNGENFSFTEQAGGIYKAGPLILNNSEQYRLKITTTNGDEYQSDYVPVSQTPAIDSITWQQQNDVTIYANTHDQSNNTKYYRRDFTETWQYRSTYDRTIAETNGIIYYVDSTTQTYNCWSNDVSAEILLGSTVALSQNIISMQPITLISQNDDKIAIRYSILVKQYAITQEAYQYFSILKKNTENLGSIFDAQPTQLSGNIHSVTNPSEVVIGYVTASSVSQQRIFIENSQLNNWPAVYNGQDCGLKLIPQDPTDFRLYSYTDTSYAPYHFVSPDGIEIAKRSCVDCIT
ncbi:MAG: DUF4249 domain-containing protein, partial [Ginsengibacter sp.]